MRDSKRLAEVRKLPCMRCGAPAPSQAAHSNSSKDGKGRSIKACDSKTISLCFSCHHLFDTYQLGNRQESEDLFNKWLKRTNAMLESEQDLF